MGLSDMRWDVILGGFGLFMFGINFMGDALKEFAGDKLREYIDRYTSNPFSAFLIGIVITVVMQSSSASTAITIGMVRAGLMTLEQAAGIIMGANIGTTITSFLISLDIGKYILYVIFAGAMLSCFSSRRKVKCLGNILMGFGMVFYGLDSMGEALSVIKDIPAFTNVALKLSQNPLLSLLAGTIMTGAVQASAATIGVVQKMYQAGALSFQTVLPFVFGANIGTTVTGILASAGGSTAAKRTAGLHTLFNIVGSVMGMILLKPLSAVILDVSASLGMNKMMQVALAHITFNVLATLIFFPLLKQMCALVRKIIPGEEPKRLQVDVDHLDPSLARRLPAAALTAAEEAIHSMSDAVVENVHNTRDYLNGKGGEEELQMIDQGESVVNDYDKKITAYLLEISMAGDLSPLDTLEQRTDLDNVKNLERIGDIAMNLKEFFQMIHEDQKGLSPSAVYEINRMYNQFDEMFAKLLEIAKNHSQASYNELLKLEDEMDLLEYNARESHFERMAKKICTAPVASSVYCDILSNLERMGDHCCNIARSMMKMTADHSGDDKHLNPRLDDNKQR